MTTVGKSITVVLKDNTVYMMISKNIHKKFAALVQNIATSPVTGNHRAKLRKQVNTTS